MSSSNSGFLNDTYFHYRKTGNLRPFLNEFQRLAINLCKKANMLNDYNNEDLWSALLERATIAIQHYDPKQGKPFQYFYGVIYKHLRLMRLKTKKPYPLEFKEDYQGEFDEESSIHNPCLQKMIAYCSDIGSCWPNEAIEFFTREAKLCMIDGTDLLEAKKRTMSQYPLSPEGETDLDLLMVRLRKKCLGIVRKI